MRTSFHSLLASLLCVLVLGACATPSVHPIYLESDKPLEEPGLLGTWKTDDDKTTYMVTRAGGGYTLVVRNNEQNKPHQWEFAVRLVQLGEHRFADFAAATKERETLDERWGPFFVPTHMFARWKLDGDSLTLWLLKREWLQKAIADRTVALAHTSSDENSVLITAETAEVQAFLRKWGGDGAAFADQVKLKREKP